MQPALADAAPGDRDLIEMLRGGAHEPAFAQLLQRYEGKVYRLCCALLRDTTQAQDAAQESWVRIWKALPRYDERASLSTWIYTITRNRCLSALERRRALASLSDGPVDDEVQALHAGDVTPDEASEHDDRCALLRELVELLPERQRRVLTLFYYEGRSVAEAAEMLGMPAGSVKTALFRARAALGEQLRRRGLDDPRLWLETGP